jgi:hypothetical protein
VRLSLGFGWRQAGTAGRLAGAFRKPFSGSRGAEAIGSTHGLSEQRPEAISHVPPLDRGTDSGAAKRSGAWLCHGRAPKTEVTRGAAWLAASRECDARADGE